MSDAILEFGFLIRNFPPLMFLVLPLAFTAVLKAPEKKKYFFCLIIFLLILMVLFVLALVGPWHRAVSDPSMVGGLLPYMDASNYLSDARLFLEGQTISHTTARRPLFVGLIVSLLWLTGGSLKISLALLSLLVAMATYVMMMEVHRAFGRLACVFASVLVITFYNRFNGVVLTEQLGLAFGLLGTAFLIRGGKDLKMGWSATGLFMLTLALNARAGAFFMLPFILLWMAIVFRKKSWISYKALTLGIFSIISAFALNSIFKNAVSPPGSVGFGNFSHTLFGLVSGGKGWFYIYGIHPETTRLTEPELSQRIYEVSKAAFLKDPHLLLVGMVRSWIEYLSPGGLGVFGFFFSERFMIVRGWGIHRVVNVASRCFFLGCLAISLWGCWRGRVQPVLSLLGLVFVGIFLSIPFAPPIDADQGRAWAANVPFLAIVVGLGFQLLISRGGRPPISVGSEPAFANMPLALSLSVIFIMLSAVLPLNIKNRILKTEVASVTCPNGETPFFIRVAPGSHLRLVGAAEASGFTPLVSDQLNIHVDRFHENLSCFEGDTPVKTSDFKALPAGTSLVAAPDLITGGDYWFIVPSATLDSLRAENKHVRVCGVRRSNRYLSLVDIKSLALDRP